MCFAYVEAGVIMMVPVDVGPVPQKYMPPYVIHGYIQEIVCNISDLKYKYLLFV